MKEAIRQRALELGFNDCRFTTAAPPATAGHLRDWLAAGQHAGMDWLARNADKRMDPQLVLPGVKTVIALAVSYADPARETAGEVSTSGPAGIVARYARHADYHEVLAEPLKGLADFTDQVGGPGTRSRWYVDTGPVLERDLAQRAGLGFAGKHTNLISRRLGNWFLLAEILTTLEVEPDAPAENHCGKCSRCLTACPTGALPAPFSLDARRCISYLTIELKGSIPVELRPLIGSRIFGCDDCLAACPWNRFARESALLKPFRREDLATQDLIELLALDDAGFKARCVGTPLLRSKRRGLLRNVCVALGNVGGRSALPPLSKARNDPEPLIAEHAAWAIQQIEARQ